MILTSNMKKKLKKWYKQIENNITIKTFYFKNGDTLTVVKPKEKK